MSLFIFLSVLQGIVAAALVGIVLMQRSEGGGLGMGGSGSPGGLMSARGAADFLTRTTKWLGMLFVALAIVMAALAAKTGAGGGEIDDSLQRTVAPAAPDPLAPVTTGAPAVAPAVPGALAPAPAPSEAPSADPADPLAGVR